MQICSGGVSEAQGRKRRGGQDFFTGVDGKQNQMPLICMTRKVNCLQKYAVTLRTQLNARGPPNAFGERLSSSQLEELSGEQITQLYSLYEEIHKEK